MTYSPIFIMRLSDLVYFANLLSPFFLNLNNYLFTFFKHSDSLFLKNFYLLYIVISSLLLLFLDLI